MTAPAVHAAAFVVAVQRIEQKGSRFRRGSLAKPGGAVQRAAMICESEVTFAGSHLDRADRLHADAAGMARLFADPASLVLPFWHGQPLFDLTTDGLRLAWLSAGDPLIAGGAEPEVFLGLDAAGTAHFAVDVSHLAQPDETPAELPDSRVFIELRMAMAEMDHAETGIAAAKGIFEWRQTHRFCACCGARNQVSHGGWRARCAGCGREHFPRVDPVVIMLILDGDRVLLGRQATWPERMYSLLAGFIEPGETIEQAVRREVAEEAAISVGEVRYLTSQPWPFPASLMLGCMGRAESRQITVDPHEMEDALWASKAEIAEALAGRHDRIIPARRGAIARTILKAWVEGRVPGFD